MSTNAQPTSDKAARIVIIRTEDEKVPNTTHLHSGCDECLVDRPMVDAIDENGETFATFA